MSCTETIASYTGQNDKTEIEEVLEIFRYNLRLLRHSEGLSATELSLKLNLFPKRIADLEGGRMPPNLSDVVAIVDYFPITFDDLLDQKIPLQIPSVGR